MTATVIGIEVLARETGLHPDTVRRLVRLGLVETEGGTMVAPVFDAVAAPRLTRALRLRRDLGLNYAGAALAVQLLARIEELEERLRRHEPPPGPRPGRSRATTQQPHAEVITWTRTV